MKFEKVNPAVPWTKEQTEARINLVGEDMKVLNQEINDIDNKISVLIETKIAVKRKISNKQKYKTQLEAQLLEFGWVDLSSEQNDERSVATEDDSSNEADPEINSKNSENHNPKLPSITKNIYATENFVKREHKKQGGLPDEHERENLENQQEAGTEL